MGKVISCGPFVDPSDCRVAYTPCFCLRLPFKFIRPLPTTLKVLFAIRGGPRHLKSRRRHELRERSPINGSAKAQIIATRSENAICDDSAYDLRTLADAFRSRVFSAAILSTLLLSFLPSRVVIESVLTASMGFVHPRSSSAIDFVHSSEELEPLTRNTCRLV